MSERYSTNPLAEDDFRQSRTRPVAWNEHWRLHRLRLGQMVLGSECEEWEIEAPGAFPRPLIIVGEVGAGMTSFFAWLRAKSQNPAVHLNLENPPVVGPDWRAKCADLIERFKGALPPRRQGLASSPRFSDWVEREQVVILESADCLDGEVAEVIFGELRGAVERRRLVNTCLIVGVRHEHSINEGVFSDFATVCDTNRLGYFRQADVEALLGAEKEAHAVAEHCVKWTGGQPLLVQLFLALRDRRPDLPLEQIGASLRDAPPRAARHWQVRLAELVRDPRLRQITAALVGGQILDDAGSPLLMHQLFVAGWTRIEERRWAIRSECHRAWARPVLQDPAAYREG